MLEIDCDALLIPTGPEFHFSGSWAEYLGSTPFSTREPADEWGPGAIVKDLEFRRPGGPAVYAGQVAVGYLSGATPRTMIGQAAAAAVAFVREASRLRPAHHRASQPVRLAVPLVGTGFSGLGQITGDLVRPVVDGLQAAAAEFGADVILCIVDDRDWSAVQWVRSAKEPEAVWRLPEGLRNQADVIADHVRSNNLVLFMGAGVGRDAGLPDWDGLLEDLAQFAGMSAEETAAIRSLDPRDRARLIERRADGVVGRAGLREFIAKRLRKERFGLSHALLASLGVSNAVTTNFDSLYEQAFDLLEGPAARPRRLPYEPVMSSTSWLLKLHGDVGENDVVITRSDYLGLARHRSALFGVVQALLLTRHLLFVGYSMSDDDFHALVDEIESALGPGASQHLGTALVLQASLSAELWNDMVDIVVVDGGTAMPPERALLMLLDRVACLSADRSAHLLDPAYEGLLDDDEHSVASALKGALSLAAALPKGSVARLALETLEQQLGGCED
jgi:hypothetical protein